MEWVPAIISIMGAVVVWVNAALTAFTGGGFLTGVFLPGGGCRPRD